MNQIESLHFKILDETDLILLYQWFEEPTINQWYAKGRSWSFEDIKKKYLPRILGKEKIPSFIIYIEDIPLGYIQYYSLSDYFPEGIMHSNHFLFHLYRPDELVGIDLFIAFKDKRGKGLGVHILNNFLRKLPSNIHAVILDPESHNQPAICCYEKAGFKCTDYSEDETHVLLIKTLQ